MVKRPFAESLLLATLLAGHVHLAPADETTLSLAGTWEFRLDATDLVWLDDVQVWFWGLRYDTMPSRSMP